MFETFHFLMRGLYGLSCFVYISSESKFSVSKLLYVIVSEAGSDDDGLKQTPVCIY